VSDLAARNRQLVERFWSAVYRRDFDAVEAMCHAEGEYTDVFSPGGDDDVARGPKQMVGRLRLGLEPLSAIYHHPRHLVAEGDIVMWEHAEEWHWHTGEAVTIRFVTVHEIRDGLVYRWHDYPDLQKLLAAAPQWWMEHIMQGYARDDA
jgi:ketosteroid isomerase-like protein